MNPRAIKIAVLALGGQGGGVLASWIVKAGELAGFIAQSTSVPGVAQRTGATIYYVELFPKDAAASAGKSPVLALMPAPGDVDIVISAEMMEAGRAVMRGFVSDGTTLISSTHRVYAIGEKISMGDGRQDAEEIKTAAERAAKHCVWLDMEQLAEDAGAVISAVMFGALAGSGAAPLPRSAFEETIRTTGRAVERNLKGFSYGFDAAIASAPKSPQAVIAEDVSLDVSPSIRPLVERVSALPAGVKEIAFEGLKKVVDFQDVRYGELYLDRLQYAIAADRLKGGEAAFFRLSKAVAKHLALWMSYDDVVRVADLKTRSSRFARFRDDVRAADNQILRVWEYMHPRIEEICDLMPPPLARALLNSKSAHKAFSAVLGKGRRIATTDLSGFFLLNTMASLRFLRRGSYRYAVEQARIENWLSLIASAAERDYALACEIAGLQRLIKGYGDTHERGLANYQAIIGVLDAVKASATPSQNLARLKDSALKDEDGVALGAELSKYGAVRAAAA